MRHVFVVNPKAGKKDITKEITKLVNKYLEKEETFIYVTTEPLNAKEFVSDYCEAYPDEELRFYSCGGDGTLNEVANGAYSYQNAQVTCYPSGSGNDFVKYFGTVSDFLDLENLINGRVEEIDMLKLNGRFVLNVFNIGFDANVAKKVIKYKRLPLVTGKGAYLLGVLGSFFEKLGNHFRITVDGEVIFDEKGLLSVVANGVCYGGGFYCAPKALVNDGLLDILAVKKVRRMKFVKLMGHYKKGTHLDNPDFDQIMTFKQGKHVILESDENLFYAMDGEIGESKRVEIRVVEKSLKFVVPRHLELR